MPSILAAVVLLIMTSGGLCAQPNDGASTSPKSPVEPQLIQLSGLVLDHITDRPIPFASVVVPGTYRGAAADAVGFFTFVTKASDSLWISAVGYKPRGFRLPDSVPRNRHSIAVHLLPDTVLLDEVDILPYPDYNAFRDAIVNYNTPGPEDSISSWGGFRRIDNPIEPPPSVFNPVSLFYDKVIQKIKKNKRKRNKSNQLPKFD